MLIFDWLHTLGKNFTKTKIDQKCLTHWPNIKAKNNATIKALRLFFFIINLNCHRMTDETLKVGVGVTQSLLESLELNLLFSVQTSLPRPTPPTSCNTRQRLGRTYQRHSPSSLSPVTVRTSVQFSVTGSQMCAIYGVIFLTQFTFSL